MCPRWRDSASGRGGESRNLGQTCWANSVIDRPISVSEPEVRDADDLHGVAAQLRHLHAAALLPAVEEQTRGQGCWMSSIFILIHEDDFFRYVDW